MLNVRSGSTAVLTVPNRHFWSNPMNGHHQTGPVGPVGARSGICLAKMREGRVTCQVKRSPYLRPEPSMYRLVSKGLPLSANTS